MYAVDATASSGLAVTTTCGVADGVGVAIEVADSTGVALLAAVVGVASSGVTVKIRGSSSQAAAINSKVPSARVSRERRWVTYRW